MPKKDLKDITRRFLDEPTENIYHSLLVNFVLEKNDKVEKSTGIIYADRRDILDILSWDYADARRTYEQIRAYVNGQLGYETKIRGLNAATCPWCLKLFGACELCAYRKHHGPCSCNPLLYIRVSSKININYKKLLSDLEKQWRYEF